MHSLKYKFLASQAHGIYTYILLRWRPSLIYYTKRFVMHSLKYKFLASQAHGIYTYILLRWRPSLIYYTIALRDALPQVQCNICHPEVFNTCINIQWCINQTQQNFIIFIFVLGQHVSILTESSSGPSKKQVLT